MSAAALHGADAPERAAKAYLNEVFLSFQGEGVLAGVRQVFVRLAGCDIRCPWCDTPDALLAKTSPTGRVETCPNGPFTEIPNPVTAEQVAALAHGLAAPHGPVTWAAITGGEPTIWRRFLQDLAPRLREMGLRIYLETNSHHPETLDALGDQVDFVSADLKVPFADYTIEPDVYRAFLRRIPMAGQVKIVCARGFPDADVEAAARLVAESAPHLPLILQPLSPVSGYGEEPPTPEQLLRLQRIALGHLADVRIIPQLHKALGVR